MSPRQKVAIATAIFSALGIGVSVGIIAAGGGFSGGPAPSILHPPTSSDIWHIGNNLQNDTTLQYNVTAKAEHSSLDSAQVLMTFQDNGSNWKVKFTINNNTKQSVEKSITLSKQLTREGQLDNAFRPFFDPIRLSILAVRDMDYSGDPNEPKYLVPGAPWDTIIVGSSSVIARITDQETIQTHAGTFQAFVLSYKLQDKTSKIWIVKNMPLPVKAEVYDAQDNLQYKYELVKMSRMIDSTTHL